MPDVTHRRSRVQATAGVAIAALMWLAASAGAIGPVAAGDPSASPSSARPSDAPPSSDPTPTPTPSPTPPPVPTVTFYGRGYGHGLGMSQYGALGRARAGQTAAQILAHYYADTTLGTESTGTTIRVLVVSGFRPTSTWPARVLAHGGPWTVDGVTGTWPAGGSATLVRTTTPTVGWRLVIASRTGAVLRSAPSPASVRIRAAASATTLQVWFEPSYYDTYRGAVRLIGSSSGTVSAIDETTVESYLRGVVPAEMPSTWPAEALRAQAIAARSYAAAHLRPGVGTYDVTDDSRSQVFRGVLGEKATTTVAVVATAGRVLRSGGHIITAMFHSADGGATENNENVYVSPTGTVTGTPISYLRGEPDRTPTGASYDAASPHATWHTATYTYAQLSAVFAADPRTAVGDLTAIAFIRRGVSGRAIAVRLGGSLGSKTVSGEIFRSVFNLYTPATDPYMWSTLVSTAPLR
jgi:stage II sporulation protein D